MTDNRSPSQPRDREQQHRHQRQREQQQHQQQPNRKPGQERQPQRSDKDDVTQDDLA